MSSFRVVALSSGARWTFSAWDADDALRQAVALSDSAWFLVREEPNGVAVKVPREHVGSPAWAR
jgi:hypothetical protein